MQQCKRVLNHETLEAAPTSSHQSIQAVSFQPASHGLLPVDSEYSEDHGVVDKMDVVTTSTNFSDDYAHRGEELRPMCLYVYRIFVRRVRRHCHQLHCPPNIFRFESHYALAGSYALEVMLHSFNVPTIDGFQCPTVHQDAEQNALLKALLFTPFCCTTPMTCGSVLNFRHMLSSSRGSGQLGAGCAFQSTSTNQPASSSPDVGVALQSANESYTFKRAWKLRHSEIHVLAARADSRHAAARKHLVLADTALFAEMKEPRHEIEVGESIVGCCSIFVADTCGVPWQNTPSVSSSLSSACL